MRVMMIAHVVGLGLLMACQGTLCRAQVSENDLRTRLLHKPLMLRGSWRDDKLAFDSNGKPQGTYKLAPFTTCGIDVKKVLVSGDTIRIEGVRVALGFERNGSVKRVPLPVSVTDQDPEPIRIDIDAHGSTDISAALDAIFANDLAEMVPQMPSYWQTYARKHFLPPGSAQPDAGAALFPAPPPAADGKPAHVGGKVKPPSIVRSQDADFSSAARRAKFSGNVQVYLVIDTDGTPSHLAVAVPAGYGLEEQAIYAVSQYKFKPAIQDGVPVKVDLYIEVNFQIF